jgi:hypothetical protein
VTLLGAILAAAAPAHAARPCYPRGSHTEARSAAIRVFRLHSNLLGCRIGSGRPQLVNSGRPGGPFAAHGANAAVALVGCDNLGCATRLRVVRVRRHASTPRRSVYTTAAAAYVARLELGPRAALAWTECEPDPFGDYLCGAGGDSVNSVWVSSRRAPVPVRLDRGRRVRVRSVSVAHGRVHWRTGGDRRSAPIP